MKSRYNPVLLAVIVIGLVCALWLNYSRYEIEEKNRVAVDRQPLIWYRAKTVTYKQYFDICNRNDMCSIIQNM